MFRYSTVCLLILFLVVGQSGLGDESLQFNRDIRPILSDNCLACHGQDANKRKADLRLDDGPAVVEAGIVVSGDAEASELISRIYADDPELIMPPPDSNRQLTDQQKQLLFRWVNEGAEYERHWAFTTPTRPAEPRVEDSHWVRNPIDRFILQKHIAHGLWPSPEADRATLIKRLSIDLVGLPPTPEDVQAFVADPAPDAYEKLVDRLLDDEHYGERMALPWLDAARYADSNGFQQDGDTWQWIWRDWLVRALNEDLPFDQFTIWQLAGDLLPDATTDQRIASGFNRNHLLNGEGGAIPEEQRFVNLFDRIDTTATTWLGLTIACAQCHDHKYDPITKRDYYSLLDAFNRVPERGTPQRFSTRIRVAAPFLELPTEANQARIDEFESQIAELKPAAAAATEAAYIGWRAGLFSDGKPHDGVQLSDELLALLGKSESDRSAKDRATIEKGLKEYYEQEIEKDLSSKLEPAAKLREVSNQLSGYRGDQIPRVMIMSDDQPRDTHILDRGEYLKPLEKVTFATPAFLPSLPEDAPQNRLGLAQWLVSSEHPLTARVQVNRMWQYFFGIGIVKTSEDFGVQSEYPIHRELLDWMAVEFCESGWSMKRMHRLIVTSATYRQSSRITQRHREVDPENRLYARASRFRMPSMILRDWALASSGLLQREMGGAPVYPYQPDNVWEALAITKERDFTYPASTGDALYRRSLYTFWRRTVQPANMFDSSNRQACRVRLSTTSTPLHALTTLNDPTWVEAARVLAERVMKDHVPRHQRLADAFDRVLCRPAKPHELARLESAYQKQRAIYAAHPASAQQLLSVGISPRDPELDATEHAALTSVCLGILNLDEALTRE